MARPIDPRRTQQYEQGSRDYRCGKTECEYRIGDVRRTWWWTGYLDARTNTCLGAVLRRHGMAHP